MKTQDSTVDSLSAGVVKAVAEHEGVAPTEVEPPLYEAIDPDALDALFSSSRPGSLGTTQRVSFPYAGHEVQVTGDGEITILDA